MLINLLAKLVYGVPLSTILSYFRKYHPEIDKHFFAELFIHYGDPTYSIDEFYESEIKEFEKIGEKLSIC